MLGHKRKLAIEVDKATRREPFVRRTEAKLQWRKIAVVNTALREMAVKLYHHGFVIWSNWAHIELHPIASDKVRGILRWIWPNCRPWKIVIRDRHGVQDHARI